MANTIHLYLTANGTKIDGDSTILSMDRENSIECLSFEDSVRTAREAAEQSIGNDADRALMAFVFDCGGRRAHLGRLRRHLRLPTQCQYRDAPLLAPGNSGPCTVRPLQ